MYQDAIMFVNSAFVQLFVVLFLIIFSIRICCFEV